MGEQADAVQGCRWLPFRRAAAFVAGATAATAAAATAASSPPPSHTTSATADCPTAVSATTGPYSSVSASTSAAGYRARFQADTT